MAWHESFLVRLDMNVPVRELRAQAGVFLDKIGTLYEVFVMGVRTGQAPQRENGSVADLQESV